MLTIYLLGWIKPDQGWEYIATLSSLFGLAFSAAVLHLPFPQYNFTEALILLFCRLIMWEFTLKPLTGLQNISMNKLMSSTTVFSAGIIVLRMVAGALLLADSSSVLTFTLYTERWRFAPRFWTLAVWHWFDQRCWKALKLWYRITG